MKRVTIATGLLCVLFAATGAQEKNRFAVAGVNEREVEVFFTAFKEAVAHGQKQKVAVMVSYPISVPLASSGRHVKVSNSARFVKLYDQIFDAKFKQLIASTEFKDLWAKYLGVATPRGEIWINGVARNSKSPDKYDLKITSINGPIPR
jgi:hypothetical protein